MTATSGLYFPKLGDDMRPGGFCILGDSAFPRISGQLCGKIIRSRKSNELSGARYILHDALLASKDLLLEKVVPSERQSAE